MQPAARTVARVVVAFLAYGLVAMSVSAPVAAERAVEGVSFQDRLGALPVQVTLAHNGVSTLDTGILGRLYWDRTGSGVSAPTSGQRERPRRAAPSRRT